MFIAGKIIKLLVDFPAGHISWPEGNPAMVG
jgi:hypothetical protein